MFAFEGRIWQDGKFWIVQIPALDIITQGKSRNDGYRMAADAIETYVFKRGFSVFVVPRGKKKFLVSTEPKNLGKLIGLLLRQQRSKQRLSVEDMRTRLRFRSRASYLRYESGKGVPTIAQLSAFLEAMGLKATLLCRVARATNATRREKRIPS